MSIRQCVDYYKASEGLSLESVLSHQQEYTAVTRTARTGNGCRRFGARVKQAERNLKTERGEKNELFM